MKTTLFSIRSGAEKLAAVVGLSCILGAAYADTMLPAVFVNISRTAAPAGTVFTDAPTSIVPVQGGSWNFSAAAMYPGTTWNDVRLAATSEMPNSATAGYFPFPTANNVTLTNPDGTPSLFRLTVGLDVTSAQSPRQNGEPAAQTGSSSPLGPSGLMNGEWRVFYGSNGIRLTLTNMTPGAYYLVYGYASGATGNAGAKFYMDDSNVFVSSGTSWFETTGASSGNVFVSTGSVSTPAKLQTASAAGQNTSWGVMYGKVNHAGQLIVHTWKNTQSQQYINGFQIVPYPAATITQQPPATKITVVNYNATIPAVAKDLPQLTDADQNPLTYQWQVFSDGTNWTDLTNTAPFSDVTTTALKITGAQFSHAAKYRVKVTNIAGLSAYSDATTLTIINQPDPLVITQQPQPKVAVVGDNVSLSVGISGTPPFSYVWEKSLTGTFTDAVIVGDDSATLRFPKVGKPDTAYYRVTVFDVTEENNVVSNAVSLYVEYAKPIITPPGPQTVAPGGAISLYGNVFEDTTTTANNTPINSLQWQVSHDNGATWTDISNGGAYSGANNSTLYINGASTIEAGQYRLVAKNDVTTTHGAEGGTTVGGAIKLTVAAPIVAHPSSVTADKAGNLYVTDDTTNTVYRFTLASGTAVLFAGQSGVAGSADGFYAQATFNGVSGAAAGAANTVFLADTLNHTIRYAQANGDVETIAGAPSVSDNIDATGRAAAFNAPAGISSDAAGNLYVADKVAHTIRRITPVNFDVTTLAGSAGNPGNTSATITESSYNPAARFNSPGGIVVSPFNMTPISGTAGTTYTPELSTSTTTTIFAADSGNNVIRRILITWYLDRDPITNVQTRTRIQKNDVSTFVGSGSAAYAAGTGTNASFNNPTGIAISGTGAIAAVGLGRIYVADTGNNIIRRITYVSGTTGYVDTIGGLPGVSGYQDGPNANSSLFNQPRGVSVDNAGNVYVADTGNSAIRMITPDGKVSTLVFAQGATPTYSGSSGSGNNGGTSGTTVMPPAGSGDRGGDGGGAPSHWYLAALALLGLTRIAGLRRHFMNLKNYICVGIAALICAGIVGTQSAHAADNPAVFVTLTRNAIPTSGPNAGNITPVASNIAAPGGGWTYSAAAPYPGTMWNAVYVAAGAQTADGILTEAAPLRINSLNNVTLVTPSGTASGLTLVGDVIVASPRAGEPTNFAAAGGIPAGHMDKNWRINNSGNYIRFTLSGLPAGAHYLFYGYAANGNVNQGARYNLDAANVPAAEVSGTSYIDLAGRSASTTVPNIFATTGGVTRPIAGASLNTVATTDSNTQWGVMHAVATASGQIIVRTARSSVGGNHYFNGFQLIPYPKATITTDVPDTAIGMSGNAVSIPVTVAGFDANDLITYQWRKDGVNINPALNTSATTATLAFASAAISDTGDYDVVVTNYGGTIYSGTTELSVSAGPAAPVITSQPVNQNAVIGGPAGFSVEATGVPQPTFAWQKSTDAITFTPIASATSATYSIASAQASDAGSYRVVISNTVGTATSDIVTLTTRNAAGIATVVDGFAATGTVTGGASGTTYVVATAADLLAKLALATPATITVSGTINVSSGPSLNVASNKTLQGADANAAIIGTINIKNVQNVIVRGLNITNPGTTLEGGVGPRYVDGGDGITIQNATGVLVTHCSFVDCADGMCDLTYNVSNATISWCKFSYTAAQTSHRFTMILGNEATTTPITATLHHNWWSIGCDQRMPASSMGRAHMYDNYFDCAGNSYASDARDNAQFFSENNYYNSVKSPLYKELGGLIRAIGNVYNNCIGNAPDAGNDLVFTPPYSYELDTAANVPTLVPQYAGNTDGAFSATPAASSAMSVVGVPQSLFVGGSVNLVPSLAGGTSFQWRLNNIAIPGATSETLALTNVQAANLGAYTVAVGTTAGKTTLTSPATIAFSPAPSYAGTTGGANALVTGKSITITVPASGYGLGYQWQQNINGVWTNLADNSNYAGSASNALTIQNATAAQAGQYRLVTTNPTGSATSNPYTITINPVMFPHPTGIAVDTFGDVYVADSAANIIRKITPSGSATLYAGIPNTAGFYDGAFGLNTFNSPGALAIDASGNLYVADTGNAIVRRVSRNGSVETLAGDPTKRGNTDGIGTTALFTSPNGLAFDRTNGVTYVADTNNQTIRRLTPINQAVSIFVGNTVATVSGVSGATGYDDALVVSNTLTTTPAKYDHPGAVAFTTGSFVYIADTGNSLIRKLVVASGTYLGSVMTIAGTPGVVGTADGSGNSALFNHPEGITVDYTGSNAYIADTKNHTIRKVTTAGVVTTIAGQPGVSGYTDGAGATALFNNPTALAIDVSGSTLYIADTGNAIVRKITLSGANATVTTIAVASSNDTLPTTGTSGTFTPTVNPDGGGNGPGTSGGNGGGGAPSQWFLVALAALAFTRFVRSRKN